VNLLDLAPDAAAGALTAWLRKRNEPAYRLRQVLPRLWQRPVPAWGDATDLPSALRAALEHDFPLPRPVERARRVARDGTIKLLWEFADGQAIESVIIPEGRRHTLCVSSQVGCAYGCVFCATGRMGFSRHLSPGEIAGQLREIRLRPDLPTPGNVVFMGMGEPLHNWSAVDTALTILHHPDGLGLGARHVTVSTIGIVPALERLAARPEQFRVALSLHASTSARRARLMPIEKKYPLRRVIEVLRRFPRRVTFEYVMIDGLTDADDDADPLAALALELGAHVNLLPLHPGGAPGLVPSPPTRIRAFAARLRGAGAKTTVRRSRGLDIEAACGQLRLAIRAAGGVEAEDYAHVEQ
jgi:23S rRNA (adenine2503-C2)-methyltransferase